MNENDLKLATPVYRWVALEPTCIYTRPKGNARTTPVYRWAALEPTCIYTRPKGNARCFRLTYKSNRKHPDHLRRSNNQV